MTSADSDTKNTASAVPELLTPGQLIRPTVDCATAVRLVESLYGLAVLEVHQLDSYDDRNFHVRVSTDRHSNPHVQQVSHHGYVLKIMNSIDSRRPHVGAYILQYFYELSIPPTVG